MKGYRALFLGLFLLIPAVVPAEEAPPASPWSGSFGAGLALTSGNTDTENLSFTLGVSWDPKTNNLFKADALYLRGKKDGDLTVDQQSAGLRYERKLADSIAAFGEVRYSADTFKQVDAFWSGTVGISWTAVKNDALSLSFDAGVGGYSETLTGQDRTSGGAYRAGEAFAWKISPNANLLQNFTGIWKSKDTGDAVYHGELALSTSLTSFSELKIGIVDDYRTRPASPELKKNDIATIAALVVKF